MSRAEGPEPKFRVNTSSVVGEGNRGPRQLTAARAVVSADLVCTLLHTEDIRLERGLIWLCGFPRAQMEDWGSVGNSK